MKLLSTLAVLFSSLTQAAPYHGNFLICASEDNNLKMTADLSDGRGEKVAVAVLNGRKILFPEMEKGKPRFQFAFYPSKKTPLVVTGRGQKDPEILVSVDPEHSSYSLVYDRKEPVLYSVAKFNAVLSVKKLQVVETPVACTESKWESN